MISKILISIPPIFKQFWPSSRKVFLQFLVTEPALETVGIVRWPVAGVSCSCNCTFSAHVHTRIVTRTGIGVYTYGISRHARYVPFQCMPAMLCLPPRIPTASHGFWSRFSLSRFSSSFNTEKLIRNCKTYRRSYQDRCKNRFTANISNGLSILYLRNEQRVMILIPASEMSQ